MLEPARNHPIRPGGVPPRIFHAGSDFSPDRLPRAQVDNANGAGRIELARDSWKPGIDQAKPRQLGPALLARIR